MKDLIIFEDDDLLILNKPAGISVTPGPGNPFEQTIAGQLLHYVGDELLTVGLEDRWGIVHRLDKDTSGVMVTAKTSTMFDHLVDLFRIRQVIKEYSVLVWGDVIATLLRKQGIDPKSKIIQVGAKFVVDAPIGRHPKGFSKFIISPNGKQASTHFTTKKIYSLTDREGDLPLTLLSAAPKTGRTHQIRVHIKAFGHPVVGDKQYQSKTQFAISDRLIQRQFLHASKISFELPSGERVEFEAPLSVDLQECLNKLEEVSV